MADSPTPWTAIDTGELLDADENPVDLTDLEILERIERAVNNHDALLALVTDAQAILSRHAPPDGISDSQAISELLGLLDGPRARAALSRAQS